MQRYALVKTSWGPFAIVAARQELLGTFLPCPGEKDSVGLVERAFPEAVRDDGALRGLQEAVRDYFSGGKSAFHIQLSLDGLTEFQQATIEACRRIPYGKTITYGELACRAGFPGSARAVGTVMSRNRFPLVVPCHRVVSTGGLGGFSSFGGLSQKKAMLELEGVLV